jgi:signal peptidase I
MNLSSSTLHSYILVSLSQNKLARLRVSGSSMRPLISRGDWVDVEPYFGGTEPQVGEIVLINRGTDFVLHRIIRLTGQEIITKGDWSRTPDPPVSVNQVIGYVVQIEKRWIKIKMNFPVIRIVTQVIIYLSVITSSNHIKHRSLNESNRYPLSK